VNQEESEHNDVDGMEKGVDSTGKVRDAYLKERHNYDCLASFSDINVSCNCAMVRSRCAVGRCFFAQPWTLRN